jgi:hypothetical protein
MGYTTYRIKRFFRNAMLRVASILPDNFRSSVPEKESEDNHVKHKDDRLDVAVKKTRLWVSLFPRLTAAQRADPDVHAVMPWQARGNLDKMAKLTEDQWDPNVIKSKADAKGKQ